MTAVASPLAPARVPARRSGPSLPSQVLLEARKSLSTRSGKALAVVAALLAPAAMALIAAAAPEPVSTVTGPLVVTGMLSVLVLLALGVLATAGEWTHGTVQTTYLLEPRRGRVLVAKAAAVALLGAALAAVAAAISAGVLALTEPSASWDGGVRTVLVVAAAGAAFALIGAGVGAALGNTPAALTGIYLLNLGVLPMLQIFKPALADKIDPGNAVLELAQAHDQLSAISVLGCWVAVSLVAGTLMTRRRAVQ